MNWPPTVLPMVMRPWELAEYLQLSTHRLLALRREGGGPPFLKIGRSVLYQTSKVEEWLMECKRTSTSDQAQKNTERKLSPPITLSVYPQWVVSTPEDVFWETEEAYTDSLPDLVRPLSPDHIYMGLPSHGGYFSTTLQPVSVTD